MMAPAEMEPSENKPHLQISARFADQVYSHLVGNYAPLSRFPLMLAIHGPPGHGKSFQCSTLLDEWGVKTFYISGSELESAIAGGPAQMIRQKYTEANQEYAKKGRACCLLIDDIDAGIGDFGSKTTYTVNRQNVSSILMNLADRPTLLDGEPVSRTPIIATANNLEALYEPLRRPGRMTKFFWSMSVDELRCVVGVLFHDILCADDCDRLTNENQSEPPAFFEQVRAEAISMVLAMTANPEDRARFLRNLIIDPERGRRSSSIYLQCQNQMPNLVFAIAEKMHSTKGN